MVRRFSAGLLLLVLSALLAPVAAAAASGGTGTYTNPILPGFHPDPSICRVGDDFYLVTSSFEWFPGVPIYHSRDLVHWRGIGHVLARASNLNLDDVECSGGIYAPTLRWHDGTFYMITTLVGTPGRGGNFIVTAKNPAGPWSDPHWIEGAQGIDPSLFFDDDGKVYYCGNGRPEKLVSEKHRLIWIQELDLSTWKLVGPRGVLDSAPYFANGKLGPVNNFEGPHLYKKDGAYYLMLSHGGTSKNHAVSIWRGQTPLGPFSEENPGNPIVTHRGDHPQGLTCTGHADLVQAPNGTWWMVLLGVRSETGHTNMGRETFLVPVDWSGRWPIVNPTGAVGRVPWEQAAPRLSAEPPPAPPARDDFAAAELDPAWTFIRTPHSEWWSLTRQPGVLTVALRPEQIVDKANPSFIGRRQEQPQCIAQTRLAFTPANEHECAGLAILRARDAAFTCVVEKAAGKRHAAVYDGTKRIGALPLDGTGPVELTLVVDGEKLTFRAATDDETAREVATVAAPQLATAAGGRFTGTFIGMYASSRGQPSKATAAFEWFEYRNR